MSENKLLFACPEPCTLVTGNVVASDLYRRQIIAGIEVWLGGKWAQYDQHMQIVVTHIRQPRQRKIRKNAMILRPDGLISYAVEQDEIELFDSADMFPVFSSLAKARQYRDEWREAERRLWLGNISQQECYERYAEITTL